MGRNRSTYVPSEPVQLRRNDLPHLPMGAEPPRGLALFRRWRPMCSNRRLEAARACTRSSCLVGAVRGGLTRCKGMTIRAAEPSDAERLLAIWLASVRATHTFLSEQDIQTLFPIVRDHALPALEVWVLIEDDVIIGFAGLSDNKLEALFLHPDHFGKGGGRLLVEHARRLKGPLLVDVNEKNPGAVRFYESIGFEVVGRSETDDGGRPFPLFHMREAGPRSLSDSST